jgi:hypothetical protein
VKLNNLQTLGLILLASALLLFVFTTGSVVQYSSGSNASVTFGGVGQTTPNSPTIGYCNLQTFATAITTGISTSEVLNASFQLSEWTGSSWTLLSTTPLSFVHALSPTQNIYQGSYALGASPGILYAISYAMVTSDVGTFTGLAYVETGNLTGYFAINGQTVTPTSVVRVSNPTLILTYTVTTGTAWAQGGQITSYVNVMDSNGNTLQKVTLSADMQNYADENLTGSYTLPAQGTYTLNGYVTYGGKTQLGMSIIEEYGSAGEVNSIPLADFYYVIGFFGLVFFVIGSLTKKTSKER